MHVTSRGDGGDSPPLDLAGYAQEFLRRNPVYRRAWHGAMRRRFDDEGDRQFWLEEMAQPWGLSFPLCAGHILVSGASPVARHGQSRRCHS